MGPKGLASPATSLIIAVLVFGIALPYVKGYDFLDPIFILGYACLGAVFAAPAATEVLADGLSRTGLLLKMLFVWGYGLGISMLLVSAAVMTVNLRHWLGRLLRPDGMLLLSALFLAAASCLATIGAAAALAKYFRPKGAKAILRFSFLVALLLIAMSFRFGPEEWRSAIEYGLTSGRLTRFALRLGTVLALAGLAAIAWTVRQPALKSPAILNRH